MPHKYVPRRPLRTMCIWLRGCAHRWFPFRAQRRRARHRPHPELNRAPSIRPETGFWIDILLVKGMKQGVAGPIRRRAGALNGFFAIIHRMPAKWTLIDRAIGVAVERHPK